MARRIRVVVAAILITCLYGAAPAVAACPAKLFFGNGLNTLEDDARMETLPLLQRHINAFLNANHLPEIAIECFDVAYATDYGTEIGIIDAASQILQDNRTEALRVLAGLDPEPTGFQTAVQYLLSRALEVELTNPNTGPDLQAQLTKYRSTIFVDHLKVIVVAHSQGNLFANSAFNALAAGADGLQPIDQRMFSIVAVATPGNFVATGEEYTTLYGDIILTPHFITPLIPLAANTAVDGTPCMPLPFLEQFPGLNALACHDFANSYLQGTYSEPRIIQQIIASLAALPSPPPSPVITSISPSMVVGSTFDLTINGTGFDATSAVDQVYQPNASFLGQGTIKSRSTAQIVVTESMAGAAPFAQPYIVKVKNPDGQLSNGASLTLTDQVSVSPGSGTAGTIFAYTGRGFTGSFNVTSHLKRPDGTEFATLQIPTSSTGTFSTTIDSLGFAAGTYEVWAIDNSTTQSSPHVTFSVKVVPPTITPMAVPPPLAGVPGTPAFGRVIVDSAGNLVLTEEFRSIDCGFGFCGTRILSISPTGAVNWDMPKSGSPYWPFLSGDPNNSYRDALVAGPSGRIYFQDAGSTLFGIDSTGDVATGWPQTLSPGIFAHRTPVIVDPIDGTVYVKVGVNNSFSGFPFSVFALHPDGSPKWQTDYSTAQGGPNFGLVQGPNGNVFTITLDSSADSTLQRLVALDRTTGLQVCAAPTTSYFDNLVGGPEGVFTSFGSVLKAYDGACQSTPIFVTDRQELVLADYIQETVLAVDDNASSDPTSYRLLGVFRDGTFLWRNMSIRPDIAGGQNPVVAKRGLFAYVLGTDLSDGKHKLFVVQSRTGQVSLSVPTAGLCDSCGVAVASNGAIYLADQSSTKLYKISPVFPTFEVLHTFAGSDGTQPLGGLIQGTDGFLYGTTENGGTFGGGTIFKMDTAGALVPLYSFGGFIGDGFFPTTELFQAGDGNFYGTTAQGGTGGNNGTIFRMDQLGNVTILHSFNGTEGREPSRLIQGQDGNLYGTTPSSGPGGPGTGTVFKIDAAGNLTPLHVVTASEGSTPARFGGLVQAADGTFYGTTESGFSGCPPDCGTVFSFDTLGHFSVLHAFNGADGFSAQAGVVLASDGRLYGATIAGGTFNFGTLFRVDRDGSNFTPLYSFRGTDGREPMGLMQGSDGQFYGVTVLGGTAGGSGTVFRMDGSGAVSPLHSFGSSDGANPLGRLVQASDGNLYGTTSSGGFANDGVIFRLLANLPTLGPTVTAIAPSSGPVTGGYR
jgi:uncharacterized repeat protein (TIGR03803 family)